MYIQINNKDILEVDFGIIENIIPTDSTSDVIKLNHDSIRYRDFKSFIKKYNKISNNNLKNISITKIISYVNVAVILQLFNIYDILKNKIIQTFTNRDSIELLKNNKKKIIRYIRRIPDRLASDILNQLRCFKLKYKIDNINIRLKCASPSLSYLIVSTLNYDSYDELIHVYKNGKCKDELIDYYYYSNEYGITNKGKINRIYGSITERVERISKDGSKFIVSDSYNGTLSICDSYDRNRFYFERTLGKIDTLNEKFLSPNMNYILCYNVHTQRIYIKNICNANDMISISSMDLNRSISNMIIQWSISEKYLLIADWSTWYIINVISGKVISKNKDSINNKIILGISDTGVYFNSHVGTLNYMPFIMNNRYVDLDDKNSVIIFKWVHPYATYIRAKLVMGQNDSCLMIYENKAYMYKMIDRSTLSKTINSILS